MPGSNGGGANPPIDNGDDAVIVRSSLERDRPERGEAVFSYLVTTRTMYNVSTYVFLLLRHVILNILDVCQGH